MEGPHLEWAAGAGRRAGDCRPPHQAHLCAEMLRQEVQLTGRGWKGTGAASPERSTTTRGTLKKALETSLRQARKVGLRMVRAPSQCKPEVSPQQLPLHRARSCPSLPSGLSVLMEPRYSPSFLSFAGGQTQTFVEV